MDYINLIDSRNLANLTAKEPYDKLTYFKQYQESFAKGEYNLKEPVYTPYGQSIRAYMSGGFNAGNEALIISGVGATVGSSIVGKSLGNTANTVPLEVSGNNGQVTFSKQELPLSIAASPLTMDKIILSMRKLIRNIQNNFDRHTIDGISLPDNYNKYSEYIRSLSRELDESKSPRIIKMLIEGMNAEIAKDKEEAENAIKGGSYRDSDEDERNKKEIYHACINILNQLKKIDEYADKYEESFERLLFINMSVLFNGILEIGQSEKTIFNDELDGIFKKEFERSGDDKKFIKDNFYGSYMSKTPPDKYSELKATHLMITQEHTHTPEGKGLNKDWVKLEVFIFYVLRQYYLGIVDEINNENAQEVKTAARKLKEILNFKTYVNLARIDMDEYQDYVVLVSMAKLKNDRMKIIPPNLPIVSLAQPPETVASLVTLGAMKSVVLKQVEILKGIVSN